MPYILDINNIAYYFSYNDLKSLLKTYFYKVAKVKNIKDDLLFQVSADTNSEDINSKSLCKTKVAVNIFNENKSIDISTYKNPILVSLPSGICDPPCDPNNCETCVSGQCISLCSSGQCCDDGVCVDQCQRTICTDAGSCSVISCAECVCPSGYSCGGSEGSYGCYILVVVPDYVTDCESYLGYPQINSWSGPSIQNGTCINGQCEYT
jgi:hypothetical protein